MAKRGTIPVELAVFDAEPLGADVIERLEAVLDEARAGTISSVAIASVYRDGSTGTGWSDAPRLSCLIGAVARLQQRLIGEFDG